MKSSHQDDTGAEPDTTGADVPPLPRQRYDLRIMRGLRQIIRYVDLYSNRLAHEFGVTVPQLLCMLKIDELGPLSVKDLAAEVFLSPSTVVGIVDRLERHGLFSKERSAADRRLVWISLTEKGREMVANSPSPLQDSLASALEELPELERATIALSLERIIELMEKGAAPEVAPLPDPAPILETRTDLKGGGGIEPKVGGEDQDR